MKESNTGSLVCEIASKGRKHYPKKKAAHT